MRAPQSTILRALGRLPDVDLDEALVVGEVPFDDHVLEERLFAVMRIAGQPEDVDARSAVDVDVGVGREGGSALSDHALGDDDDVAARVGGLDHRPRPRALRPDHQDVAVEMDVLGRRHRLSVRSSGPFATARSAADGARRPVVMRPRSAHAG